MKKSLTLTTTALLALSLTATSVSAADASTDTPITRGQFMKQVADYLQLSPLNGNAALPADVTEQSPYAAPVRILLERHIIDGYPDGTFRPEQPITKQEAGYILGRFLGFRDDGALQQLEAKFGIRFGDDTLVPSESAQQAIRASLANDSKVLEWLKQSSAKQLELKSYKADLQQKLNIRLKADALELEGVDPAAMKTSVDSTVAFDASKGMHMRMTMSIPGSDDGETVEMEQYIVPEGSFMKMPGTEGWINTTSQMPFTFEQLLQLQKQSVSLNEALLNQSFFYRDLGEEQVDGKPMRKIEINGKVHDMKQIMEALGQAMNDQSFASIISGAEELGNMSMSMNGTIWIDEATKIASKMDASMSIEYDASDALPLEGMDMHMTAVYKDFNQPVDIALPAEAKNAPEMPAIQLPVTEDGTATSDTYQ